MRSALILTVAALAVALTPAAASATDRTGKTSQGKRVLVRTGGGVPKLVAITWVATKCDKARMEFNDRTVFRFDPGDATADAVNDRGTYKIKARGGYVFTVSVILAGQRAGEKWSGTLQANAIVHRKGKKIDTCKNTVSWSAQ